MVRKDWCKVVNNGVRSKSWHLAIKTRNCQFLVFWIIGVVSGKSFDFRKRPNMCKRNATLNIMKVVNLFLHDQVVPFKLLHASGVLSCTPRRISDGTNWTFVHVHTYHTHVRTVGAMTFVGVSACALGESIFLRAMITRYT